MSCVSGWSTEVSCRTSSVHAVSPCGCPRISSKSTRQLTHGPPCQTVRRVTSKTTWGCASTSRCKRVRSHRISSCQLLLCQLGAWRLSQLKVIRGAVCATATFGREFTATLEDTDVSSGLQSVATGALTFASPGKILSWQIWAGAAGGVSLQVRPTSQSPVVALLLTVVCVGAVGSFNILGVAARQP